jgi:hypothetical protein
MPAAVDKLLISVTLLDEFHDLSATAHPSQTFPIRLCRGYDGVLMAAMITNSRRPM